ncbi:MAG: hypothetical protein H0V17_35640 [Deltaproteobacteria bacterium]|nr:hypothetical protein [Deltaproteobacteria bacterium]
MKSLVFAIALAACGGGGQSPTDAGSDDDGPAPGVCGANGTGTISGPIGGVEVTPIVRAFQLEVPGEGTAIVIDEGAGACGELADSDRLVLLFCEPPTVGEQTVVDEQTFACPSSNTASLVETADGGDFAEATGGTISVDSADGACTRGSFSIDYTPNVGEPERLTGTFAAVVCP